MICINIDFFVQDVSGKDGEIILMEYIEEFPPLMGFAGMSSKLKNYYKKNKESEKGMF